MSMEGLGFTYLPPDCAMTVDELSELVLDDEGHPDPQGLVAWHDRAMAALKQFRPKLRRRERFVYYDGTGPVFFITGSGTIQMKPVKSHRWSDGDDEFGVWWGYCQAIGEAGPTFCWDMDFGGVIDVTLDRETAESAYPTLT
jgi:hypothetical protein